MKNYNTYTQMHRFIQCDISNPNILSIVFYDKHTVDSFKKVNKNLYTHFNLSFVPKNYKPYFLWLLFWSFKNLIYKNPITRLDKQSKRHITIVALMILTILVMFIIAYYQGIFN